METILYVLLAFWILGLAGTLAASEDGRPRAPGAWGALRLGAVGFGLVFGLIAVCALLNLILVR